MARVAVKVAGTALAVLAWTHWRTVRRRASDSAAWAGTEHRDGHDLSQSFNITVPVTGEHGVRHGGRASGLRVMSRTGDHDSSR